MKNEVWAVDEQYCVQTGCNCKEVVLSFLKLYDASGAKTAAIEHPPSLRYKYESHKAGESLSSPVGHPPLEELLAALKIEHPLLDKQLQLRHLLIGSLYLRRETERSRVVLAASRTNARKVGRNEPCPCGSGRKFKHCCLGLTKPAV